MKPRSQKLLAVVKAKQQTQQAHYQKYINKLNQLYHQNFSKNASTNGFLKK